MIICWGFDHVVVVGFVRTFPSTAAHQHLLHAVILYSILYNAAQ